MAGCDWPRLGIHDDMTAEDYHQDPCKQPSLSAHIAALLISHSPLHAWTAHPKLNPNFQRKDEQKFDIGTAAHSILLQGEDIVEICDYADWRTNAAKDQRDSARKAGLIPLLTDQWQQVHAMVTAVKAQLPDIDASPPLFCDGKPEQTIIWEEDNGVMCRARLDWLRDDLRAIDDLKTTGATAKPDIWARRTLWAIGCDMQVAFYCRGVQALTGKWPEFRYLVAECFPPYAVSCIALHQSALELGQRKVDYAIRKWARCLERDHWPTYPREIAYAELDGWQDADFLRLTYAEEGVEA